MIVITAPTGKIGHQVLDRVVTAGRPVRVVARDPAKLPLRVRDRVEVVEGSHGDPKVLDRAFEGADDVFWLLPTDRTAATAHDAYTGFTRPAADALREQGVKRVVGVSALGRGTAWAGRAGHVTASLAMDDLIAGTGVAFRALALPGFMDNVLRQTRAIKEQGAFYDVLPSDRRLPSVATRDIAAVAARLLLDGSWTGQDTVPLLGPEDLSYDDMAAVVSDVLGTTVVYRRMPEQAMREFLTGSGASEGMAQSILDMMTAKEHGLDDGVVRTPQHADDTPTTFRQWCEDTLRPAVLAA
ncbi:NAD(P)H-binding protein [Actinacidiphila rubida]|uniref:Uncharacterized conserved protein YbjT, contains NAD(P)-binding and DUF2867 domains n=1 Tax=Actinacidiphila rubida TaxID=310780 RepID=A0A1H8UVS8_9ACTN|nr:NAD(P)H-binding protein [Actinacidiphila rubida]SEP07261.1 Uncharacterized conserved protein YbjT, contains NAD(P)-binding and DUF2867 domains [Actinacidiphila rubida]